MSCCDATDRLNGSACVFGIRAFSANKVRQIVRSFTDQEARGQVKALPYGRDPVTCPPCAYVRWREVLAPGTPRALPVGGRRCWPFCGGRPTATVGEGSGRSIAGAPGCLSRQIRIDRCSGRCTRPARSG